MIRVVASDASGVQSVRFLIDGETVFTDQQAPWEFEWTPDDRPGGALNITVQARDVAGNEASDSISIQYLRASTVEFRNTAQIPVTLRVGGESRVLNRNATTTYSPTPGTTSVEYSVSMPLEMWQNATGCSALPETAEWTRTITLPNGADQTVLLGVPSTFAFVRVRLVGTPFFWVFRGRYEAAGGSECYRGQPYSGVSGTFDIGYVPTTGISRWIVGDPNFPYDENAPGRSYYEGNDFDIGSDDNQIIVLEYSE